MDIWLFTHTTFFDSLDPLGPGGVSHLNGLLDTCSTFKLPITTSMVNLMLQWQCLSCKAPDFVSGSTVQIVLKECKTLFDKAFEDVAGEDDNPADSAYISTPAMLRCFVKSHRIALHAWCSVNQIMYCWSSTHVSNSLVMFYPNGNKSQEPIPGCIEHIIFEPNRDVTFTIWWQLPALPGFVDPYIEWPHFPACVYSTSLSPQLEGVDPNWIALHYAWWAFNKNYAVVLNLSCVCAFYWLMLS